MWLGDGRTQGMQKTLDTGWFEYSGKGSRGTSVPVRGSLRVCSQDFSCELCLKSRVQACSECRRSRDKYIWIYGLYSCNGSYLRHRRWNLVSLFLSSYCFTLKWFVLGRVGVFSGLARDIAVFGTACRTVVSQWVLGFCPERSVGVHERRGPVGTWKPSQTMWRTGSGLSCEFGDSMLRKDKLE